MELESGAGDVSPRRPPTAYPGLAWAVIVLAVGYLVWSNAQPPHEADPRSAEVVESLQDRLLLGLSQLPEPAGNRTELLRSVLARAEDATFGEQMRLAILAGELDGAETALRLLPDPEDASAPDQQRETARLLTKLYRDYETEDDLAGRSLTAEDRDRLRAELGWLAEAALHPAGGPDEGGRSELMGGMFRSALGALGVGLGLLALALGGVLLLIVLLVLASQGLLPLRFRADSAFGGFYAETVAVWLLLELGLSKLAGPFVPADHRLLIAGLIALLSLTALAWPVVRGVPWRAVREDLGLTWGRPAILEPFFGLAGYAATLPLLVVGLVVQAGLSRWLTLLQGQAPATPTHPLPGELAGAGAWGWAQAFFVACVVAPLVEEILFRGALYRHLRETRLGSARWLSVLWSALVSSVIFAIIHPQGLLGVPPLTALAFGFALIREVRGTLAPCMVAHAMQNGMAMLILLLLTAR